MNNRKGFTLAELLIVVAIIGILVAISIPIFTSQLEKSREATDLANARSAYAEVMAAAITDDTTATHNGTAIKQPDGTFSITLSPIKQKQDDWQSSGKENLSIGQVGFADWKGIPKAEGSCTIVYSPQNGEVTVSWSGGLSRWSTLDNTINSNSWWNHSTEREDAFNKLMQTDNSKRLESDKEILNALADYFNGMDESKAREILGDSRYNKISNGGEDTLFEYCKDGGGSIRLSNFDTIYQPYLSDIGYDARVYSTGTTATTKDAVYNLGSRGFNYVDKYLFTSNEMLGTEYSGREIATGIRIKFNVENGKITGTQVWASGKQNQGLASS